MKCSYARVFLIAGLFACFSKQSLAQQLPRFLSDSARISVMTLGPSQEELYTAFGHSAIRVTDYKIGYDLVFNYGIFSFNQPNFYLNFARGKLLYKLGVSRYDQFKAAYMEENRFIVEQALNLTPAEEQQLYAFLYVNAQPENRDYYYNYIYDNCATKIRDVLEEVFPGRITFNYPYVKEGLSFRGLMDLYLGEQPWGDLGIDIGLGSGVDITATGYHYMFLPDYIEEAMDHAQFRRGDSTVSLIRRKDMVYMPEEAQVQESSWLTPTLLFALVFFVTGFVTHREWKAGVRSKTLDFIIFILPGFVGLCLLFLWFGTDHISQYNYNLLWAFPFHFVVAFFSFSKNPPSWLKSYLLATIVILIMVIVLWAWLPQKLNLALVPVMLMLILRSAFWRWRLILMGIDPEVKRVKTH